VLQIGFFVALVAPWHHTYRVRSWQGRHGGRNPERTPHFYSENSEEPVILSYVPQFKQVATIAMPAIGLVGKA